MTEAIDMPWWPWKVEKPMSGNTFKILAGCQVQACAVEVSHHLDMLRWWNGEPVCEECFKELRGEQDWSDLEPLKLEQARS